MSDNAGGEVRPLGVDVPGPSAPATPTLASLQDQISKLANAHAASVQTHTVSLRWFGIAILAAVLVASAGTYYFVVDQTSARLQKTDAAVAKIGAVAQSSQDLGKAALEALASKQVAKTAAADLQKLGFTEVTK